MRYVSRSLALLLMGLESVLGMAQTQPPRPGAVYLAAFRTPAHVQYSKPEVFHEVVASFVQYLESRHVVIVQDPVRKRIESADLIPISTLANIARDAQATSLLVLTVDRPKTKWVKITVKAFDLEGMSLWSETVDEGGGLSGKNGVAKALDKLKKCLEPRLGHPGLEQALAADEVTKAHP